MSFSGSAGSATGRMSSAHGPRHGASPPTTPPGGHGCESCASTAPPSRRSTGPSRPTMRRSRSWPARRTPPGPKQTKRDRWPLVARPLGRGREVLRRGLVQQLSPDRRGPGRAAGSGGVLPGDLRAGAEAALPHGMELPGAGQRPALRARRRDARGHADAEGPVLPLLPEHVVQPAVLRRFGLLHVRGRAGARNQQHVPRVQQLRPRQRARRALARADGHGRRTQSPGVRAAPGRQAGGRLRAGRQAGLAPSADACQKRLFDEIKRVRPLLPKVRVDYSREPLRGRAHSRHARWGH